MNQQEHLKAPVNPEQGALIMVPKLPKIDAAMGAAYAKVGAPLWVPPSEVEHYLRCQNWSGDIALELCEWFARVWSMAFVAGVRGAKRVRIDSATVARMLDKMGYASTRAEELAALLVDGVPLLYAKGQSRRAAERAMAH